MRILQSLLLDTLLSLPSSEVPLEVSSSFSIRLFSFRFLLTFLTASRSFRLCFLSHLPILPLFVASIATLILTIFHCLLKNSSHDLFPPKEVRHSVVKTIVKQVEFIETELKK